MSDEKQESEIIWKINRLLGILQELQSQDELADVLNDIASLVIGLLGRRRGMTAGEATVFVAKQLARVGRAG